VTLLEVLVAVTIAGVAFVVLMSGFGANLKNTGIAEDYTTAAFLAKDLLAELELKKDLQAGQENGDFGENFPNYRWSTEVERDRALPFYRATVRVFFTRGTAEREMTLRTVLLEADIDKERGADSPEKR
jgi:type II secretion system protein I